MGIVETIDMLCKKKGVSRRQMERDVGLSSGSTSNACFLFFFLAARFQAGRVGQALADDIGDNGGAAHDQRGDLHRELVGALERDDQHRNKRGDGAPKLSRGMSTNQYILHLVKRDAEEQRE